MICPDCGGCGLIYDSVYDDEGMGGLAYDCETCHGTGEAPQGAPEIVDDDVL